MTEREVPEGNAHHLGEVRGRDVDDEVEAALLLTDAIEDGLDLRVVGVVTRDRDRGTTACLDLGDGAVQAGQLSGYVLDRACGQVGHRTARAHFERDSLADVLARAGDQRNLPGQLVRHDEVLSFRIASR